MSKSAPMPAAIKPKSRSRPFDFAALGVPPPGEPKNDDVYAAAYREAVANLVFRVVWITPEWAAKILDDQNTCNRNMKMGMVASLAETIRREAWSVNGETIIFADDGTLLDGQHRLRAVTLAGVGVPCLCVFGVSKDLFVTLDGTPGRKRADLLSIPRDDGTREVNANRLAATLSWVHRWECDDLGNGGCVLPYQDTLLLLDRHPDVRQSVAYFGSKTKADSRSPGLFAALHYIFGLSDSAKRDDFFMQVSEGLNVRPGSIAAMLRKWLDNADIGVSNRNKGFRHQVVIAAIVVKAWNVFVGAASMPKVLKFTVDEEKFPDIK